jgi:hypothetical protein
MNKKLLIGAAIALFGTSAIHAQQRYLDEIFTDFQVTENEVYGNNISVLTGSPQPTDLYMDVYQPPVSDTETARPLIIITHTGSFLPAVMNGQPTGSRKDSAVVEMCKSFAKRGYVAVAMSYRLGWNPQSADQDVRTGTLLNAAYRGIQDGRTCIRYFRKDAAVNGNTYKIDTTRIVFGGIGSGGYIALGVGTLNKVAEIQLGKFIDFGTGQPYVNQTLSGNFEGTDNTALNTANHVGHTSNANLIFNIGGALGDSSWLEVGEPAIIGLHTTKDPNAPYKTGNVIVPTTGDFVVEASGSYDVVRLANQLGVNQLFIDGTFNDVYTQRANQVNDGWQGLFPFVTPAPGAALPCGAQVEQGSPWDWWSEAWYEAAATSIGQPGPTMVCLARRGNPDMSPTKGKAYVDTIQGYLNPRIVLSLNLPGAENFGAGINKTENNDAVNIYPNPSNGIVNVAAKGNIQQVRMFDLTGKVVFEQTQLNQSLITFETVSMPAGLYLIHIVTEEGTIVKKISVK